MCRRARMQGGLSRTNRLVVLAAAGPSREHIFAAPPVHPWAVWSSSPPLAACRRLVYSAMPPLGYESSASCQSPAAMRGECVSQMRVDERELLNLTCKGIVRVHAGGPRRYLRVVDTIVGENPMGISRPRNRGSRFGLCKSDFRTMPPIYNRNPPFASFFYQSPEQPHTSQKKQAVFWNTSNEYLQLPNGSNSRLKLRYASIFFVHRSAAQQGGTYTWAVG